MMEQVDPDRTGREPAHDEEQRDRHEVQDGDPLVIDGEQPRPDGVAGVQVIDRRGFRFGRGRRGRRAAVEDCGTHYCFPVDCVRSVGAPFGAGNCSVRSGVVPLRRLRM